MRRMFIPGISLNKKDRLFLAPKDEAHHIRKVLRVEQGEEIEILDGLGSVCTATIAYEGKEGVRLSIVSPWTKPESRASIPLILEIACLKGDTMEWVIEKATELGVREFIPYISAHTVTQVHRRGASSYQEKWQKISDQSLKQCGRAERMLVHAPVEFSALNFDQDPRIVFDEQSNVTTRNFTEYLNKLSAHPKPIRILIGPEGGFSESERQRFNRASLSTKLSLGKTILRAETAAVVACGAVKLAMSC